MRYLFLIHGDREAEAAMKPEELRTIVEEHLAYGAMLRERGAYVGGEALADTDSWAVVRPGKSPPVTDGPFAETKEAVGGFYLVDCPTREEALELAAQVPKSPNIAVEVIPCADV